MALPATDSFTTGTDQGIGAYSSNWTLRGGDIQVSASLGQIYSNNSGTAYSVAAWTADPFNNDQVATFDCNMASSNAFVNGGPAIRVQADRGCYVFAIGGDGTNPDRARIMKTSSTGVGTLLSSNIAHGLSYPVTAKLEAIGTTLNAYLNGALVLTVTDSTFTTGNAGVACAVQNTAWRGDNFIGDNATAASTAGRNRMMMGFG